MRTVIERTRTSIPRNWKPDLSDLTVMNSDVIWLLWRLWPLVSLVTAGEIDFLVVRGGLQYLQQRVLKSRNAFESSESLSA